MAKIVVKSKPIIDRPKSHRRKKYGCLAAFGLFLILSAINHSATYTVLAFLMLVLYIVSNSAGGVTPSQRNIVNAGIRGENTLRQLLCGLPGSYCGFQNATIAYEGKTSELDIILIGPTGIFVIENKNQNGTITGNIGDQQWTQRKVGRRGGEYSKSFYNPVKQVGTHVYRLANILRSNGQHICIHAAVFFSNPETVIRIEGDQSKIPVFSCSGNGESKLIQYILNRDQILSRDDIGRIFTFLDEIT